MDPRRPLALGGGAGALSSLAFQILREQFVDYPPGEACYCPPALESWLQEPRLVWFFAGLFVGSFAGPALDLLWLLRQRWRRFLYTSLFSGWKESLRH